MTRLVGIQKYKGEFFKILEGTDKSQVGVMTLKPGQDSGAGGAHSGDQIIYVIEGNGQLTKGGENLTLTENDTVIIPAGTDHYLLNTGKKDLFFLTIYVPPVY